MPFLLTRFNQIVLLICKLFSIINKINLHLSTIFLMTLTFSPQSVGRRTMCRIRRSFANKNSFRVVESILFLEKRVRLSARLTSIIFLFVTFPSSMFVVGTFCLTVADTHIKAKEEKKSILTS